MYMAMKRRCFFFQFVQHKLKKKQDAATLRLYHTPIAGSMSTCWHT